MFLGTREVFPQKCWTKGIHEKFPPLKQVDILTSKNQALQILYFLNTMHIKLHG